MIWPIWDNMIKKDYILVSYNIAIYKIIMNHSKMNSKFVFLQKTQISKTKLPKDRKRLRNTSRNFKNGFFRFTEKLKSLNQPRLIGMTPKMRVLI